MPTFKTVDPTKSVDTPPVKRRGRPPGSKNTPYMVSHIDPTIPTPKFGDSEKTLEEITSGSLADMEGYIPGIINYAYELTTQDTGRIAGMMHTNDPALLYYYKNASQVDIYREFLSKESMDESIGKLGVTFTGGKKYNKVVTIDGERLTN